MTQNTFSRRAVAAVELAIILPVFLLILVGMIELGRSIMVQQTLAEAARAGCRLYAVQTVDEQKATDMIDKIMDDASITGYTITFDPANRLLIENDRVPVTCSVSVPYSQVSWLGPSWFVGSEPLAGMCVMPSDTGKYDSALEPAPSPEPTPSPEPPPSGDDDDDDD